MIELVIYMPLLMFVIFFTVQVALLFLGNQAASATAREAARVARAAASSSDLVSGGSDQARAEGEASGIAYARSVGAGILLDPDVEIAVTPDGLQIQVIVTGKGVELVPGMPGASIKQVVQSPIEQFRPDAGV